MCSPEESQAFDYVEPQAADYIELALDASCAALLALDRLRRSAADDERATGRISLAIAALRHAIADLREQRAAGAGAASLDFVFAGRPDDKAGEREPGRPSMMGALP